MQNDFLSAYYEILVHAPYLYAIDKVAARKKFVSSSLLVKLVQNGPLVDLSLDCADYDAAQDSPHLTQRESQILELISRGQTNREISENCAIKISTLKGYIIALFDKLGVNNRVQAAQVWHTLKQARDRAKIKSL